MQLYFRSDRLHPDLRRALVDFEHWSMAHRLPEPLISDLQRAPKDQVEYWFQRYRDLRALDEMGGTTHLPEKDRKLAAELRGESDEELRKRAEKKAFSFHCVGCAADISLLPYSSEQVGIVWAYFVAKYGPAVDPDNKWEIEKHAVIGAEHVHLGRRDDSYRKKFNPGEYRYV